MPTQQQRSDTTRETLLATFRASLLKNGLKATTTASVLDETGLSKGALYHHFRSKTALVEAIYRSDSHGAIERAVASVEGAASPIERLKVACSNWLEEMRKPDVARIVLDIGPRALGLERVLEIESELSLRLFESALEEAEKVGELSLTDTQLAARLINSMLAELAVSSAPHDLKDQRLAWSLIDAVLAALSVRDERG